MLRNQLRHGERKRRSRFGIICPKFACWDPSGPQVHDFLHAAWEVRPRHWTSTLIELRNQINVAAIGWALGPWLPLRRLRGQAMTFNVYSNRIERSNQPGCHWPIHVVVVGAVVYKSTSHVACLQKAAHAIGNGPGNCCECLQTELGKVVTNQFGMIGHAW